MSKIPPWLPQLLDVTPVARLASIAADAPHQVPIVLARVGDEIFTPIDGKPKSGRPLQRLKNIRANPKVSVLLDHYEDNWRKLWWVRVDGVADIVDSEPGHPAFAALRAKYPPYRAGAPADIATPLGHGPDSLIRITIERVSRWRASAA